VRMHYPRDEKKVYTAVGSKDWSFDLGAPARKLLVFPAEAAHLPRPVNLSIPGIYATVMDCPKGTLVYLNNGTFAAVDKLPDNADTKAAQNITVRVQDTGVKSVESAKYGPLKFTEKNGEVTFTLNIPNGDIVYLRH